MIRWIEYEQNRLKHSNSKSSTSNNFSDTKSTWVIVERSSIFSYSFEPFLSTAIATMSFTMYSYIFSKRIYFSSSESSKNKFEYGSSSKFSRTASKYAQYCSVSLFSYSDRSAF
eukprot:NODE_10_length_61504_cov_0.956502.p52 type:complete len:114 gc:universal NODE_10_length_61504_cov_0.956502:51411-51752(+)